jgi:hypothetical protein
MISFLSRTIDFFRFLSELLDLSVAGRNQSAADQPNNLAEGYAPPIVTIEASQPTLHGCTEQDF